MWDKYKFKSSHRR